MTFSFEITSKDPNSRARTGIIHTFHGDLETPYLVPVATHAEVIALTPQDIKELKIQALLANTYHLHLNPKFGEDKIATQGNLHGIMKFQKPIFTDSGGFQILSLGQGKVDGMRKVGFVPTNPSQKRKEKSLARITKNGVEFTSIYDGSKHFIDAKKSMEIQSKLGADIIMAFDECPSATASRKYIKESMERSHRWELESLRYHDSHQALYGIIHGGWFKNLRQKSARFITDQPFDGIAIGGALTKKRNMLEAKAEMYKVVDWTIEALALDQRPRHLLGIGWIDDLFEFVSRGIDTFDCVEMTRIARHGSLYISPKAGGLKENKFTISVRKNNFDQSEKPIDPTCTCPTCQNYTRSEIYERKINRTKYEKRKDNYYRLATIHNVHFVLNLMSQIRSSIKEGKFKYLKKEWLGN